MAMAQDAQRFQKLSQKKVVADRLHSVLSKHILSDLKLMLQPGQETGPLILAVALGTILSFIPAPILDTLVVGMIFARFRRINRSALIIARIVWNDLIVVPLYVPSFRFGMGLVETYKINESSFEIKLLGFSLGLISLTAAATALSVAVTLVFFKILHKWQMSPSRYS
jgi:uncharacterized protein (DUF2062 family)